MAADGSDEADREIVVSRIIEAPRQVVFDAFTSAAHLGRWCAPTGGRITTTAFDFTPGGVWDATIQGPDGRTYPNHWTWQEIVPPERIVWLYGMGPGDTHAVPTTVTLVERGDATEVTMRLVFATKAERDEKVAKYHAAQGAQRSLDALAAYLATNERTGAR
ncbi:MAG TPA: SRPBCC domain-containing protein [Candidatus Limnocylindria bacterium]|nr:SRPBCC domain-containing protein [Candidatus Limnocylindria bacterium]